MGCIDGAVTLIVAWNLNTFLAAEVMSNDDGVLVLCHCSIASKTSEVEDTTEKADATCL